MNSKTDYTVLTIVIIFTIVIAYYSTDGMKSQFIRLVDVFFIGPFLIYVAFEFDKQISNNEQKNNKDTKNNKNISINWVKYLLIIIGVATIIYNGRNYLAIGKFL